MELPPKHDLLTPATRKAIVFFWLFGLTLVAAVRLAGQLQSLLIQVGFALFLSFAVDPMVKLLETKGIRRSGAAAISLLVTLFVSVAFLALMGQMVAGQLTELVEDLPGYLESSQSWASTTLGLDIDTESMTAQLDDGNVSRWASGLAGNLVSVGTTVASKFFQVLTVFLLTYYLSADGPRMRRTVCSMLRPDRQVEVLRVWDLAVEKTGAYISSRLLLATISGLFHWVAFSLLGLPSSVALALWVGVVSQFIPAIGTYLAGILPALVALGISPIKALWVLLIILVYQQIENYALQPRITANSLDMHPGVAIVAVLAGSAVLGGVGAILALPVIATATAFFSAYIERHELVESATE